MVVKPESYRKISELNCTLQIAEYNENMVTIILMCDHYDLVCDTHFIMFPTGHVKAVDSILRSLTLLNFKRMQKNKIAKLT